MHPATVRAADRQVGLAELVRAEYSDANLLLIRERLYEWESPRLDVHGQVAAHIASCRGLILDVGCGAGRTLAHLPAGPGRIVVGIDLSQAMLGTARATNPDRPLVAGDALSLPFRDRLAAAVLAVHVLYLLSDPGAGLREMARVLMPAGLLVVVTTGEDDKAVLHRMLADAVAGELGAEAIKRSDLHRRLAAGSAAERMSGLGFDVERLDLLAELRLDDPGPLIDYVDSLSARFSSGLTAIQWAATLRRLRSILERVLATAGEIVIPTHVVVLVGRRRAMPPLPRPGRT